jgi:hypothetical protein
MVIKGSSIMRVDFIISFCVVVVAKLNHWAWAADC